MKKKPYTKVTSSDAELCYPRTKHEYLFNTKLTQKFLFKNY